MSHDADVLIVGGGLNGPAAALALASGGLRAIVLDALPESVRADPEFDGRAYAVSLASRRFWQALGVWDDVAGHAQTVSDVVISDAAGIGRPAPALLHFDHAELDDGPASVIVEDRWLRGAVLRRIDAHPRIEHRAPVVVTDTRQTATAAEAVLADGTVLRAPLLVACDGRGSPIAARAGIRRVAWGYDQTGLVCAVGHEKPHGGVAHEMFLPAGPFAILPLPGNVSSIVWTETTDEAARIDALPDAAYLEEIALRFGDFLGPLRLVGKRFSYPLKLSLAEEYARPRLALVGDAAHAVHPIAGQGLNLGVRDVAALAEVVIEARRRGEDVGALGELERYQRWRRWDATSLGLGMDAINRLFSNHDPALRLIRDAGLALVGGLSPARRFFMREAAGVEGDLPRLLRGRPI